MKFAVDLSKAIERAKGKQDIAIRKVITETFKKVIMKSPVDTGRFRANWQCSQGSYSRSTLNTTDKSGSATVGKMVAEVNAVTFDGDKKVFLVNNLPYSIRLEFGWSKIKAPQGVVRITLAEITTKYGA